MTVPQVKIRSERRMTMSGEFYEYGDPPYWSQEMLYLQLRLSRENAIVLDRDNQVLEVWIDGRCVRRCPSLFEAQRVFREYT